SSYPRGGGYCLPWRGQLQEGNSGILDVFAGFFPFPAYAGGSIVGIGLAVRILAPSFAFINERCGCAAPSPRTERVVRGAVSWYNRSSAGPCAGGRTDAEPLSRD